jgi:hypothetical protein
MQRDPAGRLWLTKEGRAVLTALLAKGRLTAMAGFDPCPWCAPDAAALAGRAAERLFRNATLRFRDGPQADVSTCNKSMKAIPRLGCELVVP